MVNCLFCNSPIKFEESHTRQSITFPCSRCGYIRLKYDAYEYYSEGRKPEEKLAIGMWLRENYEKHNRKHLELPYLKLEQLEQIVKNYRPLDPIGKMDHALTIMAKKSPITSDFIKIDTENDYFLYKCNDHADLKGVIRILHDSDFIQNPRGIVTEWRVTSKGYERLREIAKGIDSRQCFVAMWFDDEVNAIYEEAIKPAIEYIEDGETEPRFKAVRIDNVEHVNDINDEIIAQIRRSRFMVCDLTGYRGGVYFEAGFAYGLGLPVIYTCREDWTKEENLKDENENEIEYLYDSNKQKIRVKKEGVHFDLAHRNRISWSVDKPDDFRETLTNRIKAVIV